MPLYEYQCKACDDLTEVMRRFSDPPLDTCEKCGGELKKLLSAPAFQFKGSGWYVTDYARKGDGAGDGGDSKDKDKGSGKEAKTDSKKSDAGSDSKSTSKDSSGGSVSSAKKSDSASSGA